MGFWMVSVRGRRVYEEFFGPGFFLGVFAFLSFGNSFLYVL